MRYLFLVVFLILLNGCSSKNKLTSENSKRNSSYGYSFIEGTVIDFFGEKVIVKINNSIEDRESRYEQRLANKIIKNSLFIPGISTYIGNNKAYISDVRGDEITFEVQKMDLKVNEKIKIYIPKKTIAIMDFLLISPDYKSTRFPLEDMTTHFVKSGQYVVVEREELDLVLKEQKLNESGLINTKAASKIGKLVAADIILTGSFTEQNGKWSINIKLIDVETGIIIVAENLKINLTQYKPSAEEKTKQDVQSMTIYERRGPPPQSNGNRAPAGHRPPPPPPPRHRPPPRW